MKDPNRSFENETGRPVVGPPEVHARGRWRQIPIPDVRGRAETPDTPAAVPERRIDTRRETSIAARFTSVDPVRDNVTGDIFYDSSDEQEVVVNVSRRGMCLRCERPPAIGTRLVLELTLPGETAKADMIGRVCWSRVEYTPGAHGARAVAVVGIELLGGSHDALDIYDRCLGRLLQQPVSPVAGAEAVG